MGLALRILLVNNYLKNNVTRKSKANKDKTIIIKAIQNNIQLKKLLIENRCIATVPLIPIRICSLFCN